MHLLYYTNNNRLVLLSHFQILICNELLVLFSFFRLAPEEALFSNRNIGQFVLNIYIFCFILLCTSSSPCRKDQFAVSYFSTILIVLIQGPVVRRPISANLGLNFNPGPFFLSSKAFPRTTFSILFLVANHQIVDKKN